jgi:hypothetical protein
MLAYDDEPPPPPPASMVLPFAMLGAAAAFFCVLGVAVAMKDARFTLPGPAVATGAVVGALTGLALRRWKGLHQRWLPHERRLLRVALVVGAAGAAIGGFVSWWTGREWPFAVQGAGAGVACAIFFVPGASFIVESATRATRARSGSIVAGADRRSIWSTALAATALAPVMAVPATAAGLVSFSLGAIAQVALIVGVALMATCALVVLTLVEVRARRRLEVAIDAVKELAPAAEQDAAPAGVSDLGLGDVAFSRVHLRDAYRGARHGEVVLRGDPDEAREAIVDAIARRRRSLVLGLVALVTTFASWFAFASDARLYPLALRHPSDEAAHQHRTTCEEGEMTAASLE